MFLMVGELAWDEGGRKGVGGNFYRRGGYCLVVMVVSRVVATGEAGVLSALRAEGRRPGLAILVATHALMPNCVRRDDLGMGAGGNVVWVVGQFECRLPTGSGHPRPDGILTLHLDQVADGALSDP